MPQSDQCTTALIATLLRRYGFELAEIDLSGLINRWLKSYSVYWVRLAIVESLYQGRYKAISVEHILGLWQRRGQPTVHFTHDFERLVCRNLVPYYLPSESSSEHSTKTQVEAHQLVQDFSLWGDNGENSNASEVNTEEVSVVTDSSISVWDERNFIAESSSKDSFTESLNHTENNELISVGAQRSIHQFIPLLDRSRLYSKLRAAVHQDWAETASD